MSQNERTRESREQAPEIPGMIWDPERRRYFPSQTLRDPLRKAQSDSLAHLHQPSNKLADLAKAARVQHMQLPQCSNTVSIETFRRQIELGQAVSSQTEPSRYGALLVHLKLSNCVALNQGYLNTFQDIVAFPDGEVLATVSYPLGVHQQLYLYHLNGEEPTCLRGFNDDNSSTGYYLLSASEDGTNAAIFCSNLQQILLVQCNKNPYPSTNLASVGVRGDAFNVLDIASNVRIKKLYRVAMNNQTKLDLLAISDSQELVASVMSYERNLLVVRFSAEAVSGVILELPRRIFSSDILSLATMEPIVSGKQEKWVLVGCRNGLIVVLDCANLFQNPLDTYTRTLKDSDLSGYLRFDSPVGSIRPVCGTSYIVVAGCQNRLCLYDLRYLKVTSRGLDENRAKVLDYGCGYYNDVDVRIAFAFAPSTYGGECIFAIGSTDSTVQIYNAISGNLLMSLDLSYTALKACHTLTKQKLKKLYFPKRSQGPRPLRIQNLAWTHQQLIINVETGLLYWNLGSIS